ncbi:hypothetical protein Gohar_007041 [Gossypium harknessii]|uniref:Uncharacterized protein n=1 Tax=Gossypium harknessii TaxID=34285 RepID=A0A7J9GFZ3_9ROSI|nr:hypothetical protein [Gossypium harknessii]
MHPDRIFGQSQYLARQGVIDSFQNSGDARIRLSDVPVQVESIYLDGVIISSTPHVAPMVAPPPSQYGSYYSSAFTNPIFYIKAPPYHVSKHATGVFFYTTSIHSTI